MASTRARQLALDMPGNLASLARTHWLREAEPALQPGAPLRGAQVADVAIVGGGFVGLWTALAIRAERPSARVVILEKDVCGGGASGRNGGFAMSWWPKISTLLDVAGRDEALRLARASEDAIAKLGRFCDANRIDAHFIQGGWLWTATTRAQRDAWLGTVDACSRLGARPFQALDPAEVAGRTGSAMHLAGVCEASNATVQPALLVRGLRRVALERGIEIYENTAVDTVATGSPVVLSTREGEVRADVMVIATNAWAMAVPELARLITPVSSAIVVTEPIPERLRRMGWTGGESITDSQLMVGYYRTTRDGRIVYGKGTGAIQRGGHIGEVFSTDPAAQALAAFDFRRAYPALSDVKLVDSWTGPVDRTYDSLPVFGTLKGAGHISYGIGWSGNGVAPSYLGGKVLAALALGLKNEWADCALVHRSCRTFPPEPIRFIGGTMVRNAVLRKEHAEAGDHTPRWLDVRLASLAPSGLEDKS
jgi:glycine/D-amino acid oxidase-like deaminating enzyme